MANSNRSPRDNPKRVIKRHSLLTRIWHWVNFICLIVLLMSGLQIFNAHPALYWGQRSHFDHPLLQLTAVHGADGQIHGVTRINGLTFDTTGVLGASGPPGNRSVRGFPAWATLPSHQWLAMGRQWHFFFAWIFAPSLFVFLLYSLLGGHLWRDLLPGRGEWRQIGHTIWQHLLLRFPKGDAARRYNILQKLTYVLVLLVLLPLIVLTGFTMSPTLDAAFPWLLDIFDGRQSARTIHFICAFSLVAFFLVHIALVLVSGLFNNLRSMITGRYALPPEDSES